MVSHIKQWLFFTIFFGLCLLPASIDNVILFAELMAVTSGYDHIKNIIGSIGFLHKILDLPFDRDSFRLRLTLQSKVAGSPSLTVRFMGAWEKLGGSVPSSSTSTVAGKQASEVTHGVGGVTDTRAGAGSRTGADVEKFFRESYNMISSRGLPKSRSRQSVILSIKY